MTSMDLLRHLRYFVAVADEGHFGRAAAALDMTQPPLSQGLRRLEQHLGVDLLRRTRQGAVLTPAGTALLPRARLLVDDAELLRAEATRLAHTRGTVRWGAIPALPAPTVTGCVGALRGAAEAAPRVVTASGSTVALVEQVRTGALDVAVVEHPALTDGVTAGPVIKLPRRVAVPRGHRSAAAERPAFAALAGLPFVTTARAANPPAHDAARDLLRERGLDVPVVTAEDDRALLAVVAAGGGFGFVAGPLAEVPGVAWLRLAPDATALRVRVIHHPGAAQAAAAVDAVLFRERLR